MLRLALGLLTVGVASLLPAMSVQANGNIRGRIRIGDEPAAHTDLVVLGTHRGGRADEHGAYTIREIPAGMHMVRALVTGNMPLIDSVLVVDDSTVTLDFDLPFVDQVSPSHSELLPLPPQTPGSVNPPVPPDPTMLERMRRAPDVRLVRLKGEWNADGGKLSGTYTDYGVAWTRKLKDRSLRSRLVDLLARPESFDAGAGLNPKKCAPRPGVAVRFLDRAGEVEVLLCFECEVLWIDTAEELRHGGNFDRMAAEFIRWVKDAIPDDPAIQALREH